MAKWLDKSNEQCANIIGVIVKYSTLSVDIAIEKSCNSRNILDLWKEQVIINIFL